MRLCLRMGYYEKPYKISVNTTSSSFLFQKIFKIIYWQIIESHNPQRPAHEIICISASLKWVFLFKYVQSVWWTGNLKLTWVFIHLLEDIIIKSPQNFCWSDPFYLLFCIVYYTFPYTRFKFLSYSKIPCTHAPHPHLAYKYLVTKDPLGEEIWLHKLRNHPLFNLPAP